MYKLRRSLFVTLYLVCLILVVGCFYFTISEPLFSWVFPDELVASQAFHNLNGFWGCAKYYYLSTTINRLSVDVAICAMAKGASLLNTPLMGWVLDRLVLYMLMPCAMAVLLKNLFRLPFKYGIVITFLIASSVLYLMLANTHGSTTGPYMWAVDLAIYGTATASFFLLVALLPKSVKNGRYFTWFCVVYFINLTSHELFLVVSSFFILLYTWYRYSALPISTKQTIFRDKTIWILLAVYVVSALITVLAPGLGLRQQHWPASGTMADGLAYIVLAWEEITYFLVRGHTFLIVVFLLGGVFGLYRVHNPPQKNVPLYTFLFIAPALYCLVLAFLVGISPSLWSGAVRTEAFQWFEPILASVVSNPVILSKGGFFLSRILFFYMSFFLDVFLAGFFIANSIARRCAVRIMAKSWLPLWALFLVAVPLFLLHPDGYGSLRILSTLFGGSINMANYSPEKNRLAHPESSLLKRMAPNVSKALVGEIFPKKLPLIRPGPLRNHESDVTDILVNNYLAANRNGVVSPRIVGLVFKVMCPGIIYDNHLWEKVAYMLYRVAPKMPCVPISKKLNGLSACYHVFGSARVVKLLADKSLQRLIPIHFVKEHGVVMAKHAGSCAELRGIQTRGEHFIASKPFQLAKGFYYFTLESRPTMLDLYFYLFGKKENLLLPWLNYFNATSDNMWQQFGKSKSLTPVFNQVVVSPQSVQLEVIVYSAIRQKVYLRWQHGRHDNMNYQGNPGNVSSICKVQFGRIMP